MEEQNNVLQEFTGFQYDYAGAGQRFLNYLIDLIAFYILNLIAGFFIGILFAATGTPFGTEGNAQLLLMFISFTLFVIYYTVFEGAKGKTLGKLITKTKVLTADGEPVTYKQAFLRSLSRLVPFEPLSAFFGLTMWHDQWTNTIVVKDIKPL
ncbi:MAG: RDD family protein [Lacibacter sp.]